MYDLDALGRVLVQEPSSQPAWTTCQPADVQGQSRCRWSGEMRGAERCGAVDSSLMDANRPCSSAYLGYCARGKEVDGVGVGGEAVVVVLRCNGPACQSCQSTLLRASILYPALKV